MGIKKGVLDAIYSGIMSVATGDPLAYYKMQVSDEQRKQKAAVEAMSTALNQAQLAKASQGQQLVPVQVPGYTQPMQFAPANVSAQEANKLELQQYGEKAKIKQIYDERNASIDNMYRSGQINQQAYNSLKLENQNYANQKGMYDYTSTHPKAKTWEETQKETGFIDYTNAKTSLDTTNGYGKMAGYLSTTQGVQKYIDYKFVLSKDDVDASLKAVDADTTLTPVQKADLKRKINSNKQKLITAGLLK